MLEMKIKTKQDVIKTLQEAKGSFKKVIGKDVRTNGDLEDIIKSARAIMKTGGLTIFLIAG